MHMYNLFGGHIVAWRYEYNQFPSSGNVNSSFEYGSTHVLYILCLTSTNALETSVNISEISEVLQNSSVVSGLI